jgi:hypothetical protein
MIDLAHATLRVRNLIADIQRQWPQRLFNAAIFSVALGALIYALDGSVSVPASVNTLEYFSLVAVLLHGWLVLRAQQGLQRIEQCLDWLSATRTSTLRRQRIQCWTLVMRLSLESFAFLLVVAWLFKLDADVEALIWFGCYLISAVLVLGYALLRKRRALVQMDNARPAHTQPTASIAYTPRTAAKPIHHAAALHADYFRGFQQSPKARARIAGLALVMLPMSAGFQLISILAMLSIALLVLDRLVASQRALHHSAKWCGALGLAPAHWLRVAFGFMAPINAIAAAACMIVGAVTSSIALAALVAVLLLGINATSVLLGFAHRHLAFDNLQRSRNELLTWMGSALTLQLFAPALLLAPLLWLYFYRAGCKGVTHD